MSNQIFRLAYFLKFRIILISLTSKWAHKRIEKLGSVSDTTSKKVKRQYEENPYPRWIKVAEHPKSSGIMLSAVYQAVDDEITTVDKLKILVAGCGLAGHRSSGPISNSDVFIDLSCHMRSQRAKRELGGQCPVLVG